MFVGLLAGFLALDQFLPKSCPPPMQGFVMAVFMLLLTGAALVIFNLGRAVPKGKSEEEQMRQLEEQGLLVKTDYQAVRAFSVEECEDEGLHYFIELNDGGILYLCDQYLYDVEGFPCTEFTVCRHRDLGWVADIQRRGTVIKPEYLQFSFSPAHFEADLAPEAGEIVRNRSYEQFKAELCRVAGQS